MAFVARTKKTPFLFCFTTTIATTMMTTTKHNKAKGMGKNAHHVSGGCVCVREGAAAGMLLPRTHPNERGGCMQSLLFE